MRYTTADLEPLLARLRSREPRRRIRGRNATKADILVHRHEGVDLAVKDYTGRPWPVRHTLGRWLVAREARAYATAAAARGLPEFVGRGRFALVTRWVDARPLLEVARAELDARVFDRLERIVAGLHRRGVALADLHRRDVLIGAGGQVWVVDLATAVVLGRRAGRLRRLAFERARDADRVALARMRARWESGDPTVTANRVGPRAAGRDRRARRWKTVWNRLRRRRT